ncbi:hypothetical protein SHIRM173S_09971 [Streptomyces hirsutus]
MEQRKDGEHPVVRLQANPLHEALSRGDHALLAVQDALRETGGPRGVDHDARSPPVTAVQLDRLGVEELAVEPLDPGGAVDVVARGLGDRFGGLVAEDRPGTRLTEHVGRFLPLEVGVDGHEHRTQPGGGQQGEYMPVAVAAHDEHTVPGLHPPVPEVTGQPSRRVGGLGPGP